MIKDDLARGFETDVKRRGNAYFEQLRVKIRSGDVRRGIKAYVRGSDRYDVTLTFSLTKRTLMVRATCSCPFVSTHETPCKHMWATILAADDKHYFTAFESSVDEVGFEIEFADGEFDMDDDDLTDDLEDADDSEGDVDSGLPKKAKSRIPLSPKRNPIVQAIADLERLQKSAGSWYSTKSTSRFGPAKPPKPIEPSLDWLGRFYSYTDPSLGGLPDNRPIDPIYILECDAGAPAGHFVLALGERPIGANGKVGKLKRLSLTPQHVPRIRNHEDREICRLLAGVGAVSGRYGFHDTQDGTSAWDVSPQILAELLPRLFATGRMHVRRHSYDTPVPLKWDGGEPWELIARVVPVKIKADKSAQLTFQLTTVLKRGEKEQEITFGDVFFHGGSTGEAGLWLRGNELSRVNLRSGISWAQAATTTQARVFSAKQASTVLAKLALISELPPLALPPELEVHEVSDLLPMPEATIHALSPASNASGQYDLELRYRYGEDAVPAGFAPYFQRKDGTLVHRNLQHERGFRARLLEVGATFRGGNVYSVRAKILPRVIAGLLNENWRVLGDKNIYRKPGSVSVSVSSGVDWFDVTGGVDFDGQTVSMPRLLEALREGQQFVVLGDGSFGLLPEEWLAKNSRWLEMGKSSKENIRFSKAQLPLVDALLADMPEINVDREVQAARERLRGFEGIKAHAEPIGFVGQLRPYQQQGLGWLHFLREFGWGGCLADDMGLGKTIQLLAMLVQRKHANLATGRADEAQNHPSLVVAPKSLIFNWVREAEKFAPSLKVLAYTGTERTGTRESLGKHDLVVTTYGTLLRDVEHLSAQQFDYVVLDEAQAIKNPSSQSAKAVRLLRAKYRLALTGTPVENQLSDLWSIFEFLNPGMLGALSAFKGAVSTRADTDTQTLVPLQRAMRPFILRRTKREVLTELPPRTEQTITCQMGKEQTALYDELRQHYRASLLGKIETEGLEKKTFQVLEALLRLRQAACHPGLLDLSKSEMESAKLEALMPMLVELLEENHKALVFSQFTSLLALLRTELNKRKIVHEYLDGKTTKRDKHVDRFQNDADCKLMLISLKAGGVGLNLTAADYVFILDPWWNPAAEAQAIDRAHRMGQNRHVNAYRLITQGTVEEKIVQLQQSKRALADAIITEQNSLISNLTREELSELLS